MSPSVGNWVNWLLVIAGIICVIIELALGALTGFDLALIGASLAVGGGIGLLTGSANVGMLAAAGAALIYFAVFRSWLKSKLTVRDQPSKAGVVIKRISPRDTGLVKVGTEEWRAELAQDDDTAREVGATITVSSVEGVTLKVR